MELREPPQKPATQSQDLVVRGLLVVNLIVLLVVGGLLLTRTRPSGVDAESALRGREVAGKLKAAGALDEAADLYERYFVAAEEEPVVRARIAYSLGNIYLENGQFDRALRWFYESELLADEDLATEIAPKIVHCLERMGRYHAAQAALDSRSAMATGEQDAEHAAEDPVVARIGEDRIYRSEFERALDDLPPEVSRSLGSAAAREQYLSRYVGDEMLWRKATKLEMDKDPEVLRRQELVLKQLVVGKFLEQEILANIEVDEADLQNYFAANRQRYQPPAEEGKPPVMRSFEEVRPIVERDYRMLKIQSSYEEAIAGELAAEEVELFPENLEDGD
jgi:tetratricopeptide (TPR) repeat protein